MHHASRIALAFSLLLPALVTAECQQAIYLTFDVGNMRSAEFVGETLKKAGIKATFFLANNETHGGGHALDETWKHYWQERLAEGHRFGNHTWSHYYARKDIEAANVVAYDRNGNKRNLTEAAYCSELEKVNRRFREMTGQSLAPVWRAPGGRTTANTLRWASNCGYPVHVGWTPAGLLGDELPSEKFSNEVLLKKALKDIQEGDVILLHLGIRSRKTPLIEILPDLIQGLKQKGLCFATVTQ